MHRGRVPVDPEFEGGKQMGLFSKREQEPSYSRAWVAEVGGRSRKTELAVAAVARLVRMPVGQADAWGRDLDDGHLEAAHKTIDELLWQDRSLARHVTRDLTLLFEANGGITVNHLASLEAVGLDPSVPLDTASGSPGQQVAATVAAVARTIRARSEGGEASTADVAIYRRLFEDESEQAYGWSTDIGAWAAVVIARLSATDRLPNGDFFRQPGLDAIAQMQGAGWYPNPVNAGDTSMGQASIERWWDGDDWTDLARIRDGRNWTKTEVSLFTTPNN
jgi:hypothetical protein